MTVEEQHSAFPRLLGAPAYARPPSTVEPAERPFDPDALPILAEQTAEERALLETLVSSGANAQVGISPWPVARAGETASLPARPSTGSVPIGRSPGIADMTGGRSPRALAARPFSLRDLTDRLRGQR